MDTKNKNSTEFVVPIGSPEISTFSPSPNRPPKIPLAKKSYSRSVYSKPKSRFGEQPINIDPNSYQENKYDNTMHETKSVVPITPKTPLMMSPGIGSYRVEEDEEIYKRVSTNKKLKYKRVKIKVLVEWVLLIFFLVFLVASVRVKKLRHFLVWGLEIWKWCVLFMVVVCGLLMTKVLMNFIVLCIEMNFLLKKKVLYFVHGLKKSVQVFIWWSLVLVTWVALFNDPDTKRSATGKRALDYVTWSIVALLIGAFMWLLKTLLLKILAANFHVNTFFDRVQESIFHQYVVLTLSGPAVLDTVDMVSRSNSSRLSFRSGRKGKDGKKEVIDMNKLYQMKQGKVSAWTMKMLVDVISKSGLFTFSNEFEERMFDGGELGDKEITNEMEAIAASYHIFKNVAQPGCNYIDEMDLRRFMLKEEVHLVLPLIDVADKGRIDRKSLTDWVVKVYNGRKALAHALNDTKTAVKQLNKLVTGILIIIMIVVWLLLVEIATTKVLVLLSSQLVVAAFMFGNTCKTIFEAIIFVFIMHPFDVGDRCVVDGTQMIVEEMNILTTVFLRFDNEKVYYPNSVLSTKPISNFYRSPDMGDSLEFSIGFSTPAEKIGSLKEKIKKYLEKTPQYWHPNHSLVVKEIENVNKIKMALFFIHTMNFQEYPLKTRRKSELVLEMKRIFEELNIKYDLLPQGVHLPKTETTTIGATK